MSLLTVYELRNGGSASWNPEGLFMTVEGAKKHAAHIVQTYVDHEEATDPNAEWIEHTDPAAQWVLKQQETVHGREYGEPIWHLPYGDEGSTFKILEREVHA